MISRQIGPGLWYIGALDEKLRTFGKASFTEDGMMYNSYLMDTEEGCMVFGAVPERYIQEWIAQIARIAQKSAPVWAVLFGTEHDRKAAAALLGAFPDITLVGGTNALYKLEGLVDADFSKTEIRSHRTFQFGKKSLRFEVVPERYDTPCVYVLDKETGTLFTADAFGSVCADERVLTSDIVERENYYEGAGRYFADIAGSRRQKSLKAAVSFARENEVRMICPSCGPVADCELERLYSIFAPEKEEADQRPSLALIYEPGGYIGELAECIETGAKEAGEIRIEMCDVSALSYSEVIKRASGCSAYLFGTAQVQGDASKAIWNIVTSLTRDDCEGKLAAVFTSGESEGKAAENIRKRLAMLGCDLSLWDCQIKGKPDRSLLKNAYEYGYGVGCSILKIPNLRKPTLVKCLVCGEIFDASLGICPVCGVGLEQCVPVEAEDVLFKNDTDQKYVILGGGIAAVSAAEAIRRRDETGSIVMISAEDYLPINRPMLTKDLVTVEQEPETLSVHGQEWYDEQKIELHLGKCATALDPENKTVACDSGESFAYDKLIYATGAECFVPPFEGHDKPGVLTIRHLTDSRELQERMETAKKAVVIGGGVLGLEAASELMRAGIEVTVLEATPQIIGRQVDAETAAILKKQMEAMHVACFEGVSIAGIEGKGQANGVRLADGRVFPADFVVVSCGNRANVQAAKAAGVNVERSIVVNERMETNVKDIYACGDCAQFDGINYQLWQEASGQGRVAGANAAGERITYANQPLGLSLEGFGTSLFAIGDPGKKTDVPYETVEVCDSVRNRHEKYWFYGNLLHGAALVGAPEKVADISQAVTVHANYSEIF